MLSLSRHEVNSPFDRLRVRALFYVDTETAAVEVLESTPVINER